MQKSNKWLCWTWSSTFLAFSSEIILAFFNISFFNFLQLLMKTSARQIAKTATPVEQLQHALRQVSLFYRVRFAECHFCSIMTWKILLVKVSTISCYTFSLMLPSFFSFIQLRERHYWWLNYCLWHWYHKYTLYLRLSHN